jgi:hypothetical protein
MAGLVPAIRAFAASDKESLDAWHKAGHDSVKFGHLNPGQALKGERPYGACGAEHVGVTD